MHFLQGKNKITDRIRFDSQYQLQVLRRFKSIYRFIKEENDFKITSKIFKNLIIMY